MELPPLLIVPADQECSACQAQHPIGTFYVAHEPIAQGQREVLVSIVRSGRYPTVPQGQIRHILCEAAARTASTRSSFTCHTCNLTFDDTGPSILDPHLHAVAMNLFKQHVWGGEWMMHLFKSNAMELKEEVVKDLAISYLRAPENSFLPNQRTLIQVISAACFVTAAIFTGFMLAGAICGLLLAFKFSFIGCVLSIEAIFTAGTIVAKLAALIRVLAAVTLFFSVLIPPFVGLLTLKEADHAKIREALIDYPMGHIFTWMMFFPTIALNSPTS